MSQSMNDYYTDFEEPDQSAKHRIFRMRNLANAVTVQPIGSALPQPRKGYPNDATESNTECRSCGASVPDGQTKCRFCLTNHLESDAASTNESASTTFLGIIHLIVESTTFYGAVAKGGAAANLLCQPGGARRRRLHAHLRPRRGAGAPAGRAMAPTSRRGTGVVSGGRGLSVPPVTGLGGTGRKRRSVRSRPQRGSTTNVGMHPRRVAVDAIRRRRRRGVAGSSDGADRIYWRGCG